MKLDDNLPEDKSFIEEVMNEIIKYYGGTLEEWHATEGEKKVDENGIFSFKQEFIKINSTNFEYVYVKWIQTEDKKNFHKFMNIEILPFKNIFSINWSAFQLITIIPNTTNRAHIELTLKNPNSAFQITFKYYEYHEIEYDKKYFSKADEIRKFKELLDEGTITEDEFDAFKKKLL